MSGRQTYRFFGSSESAGIFPCIFGPCMVMRPCSSRCKPLTAFETISHLHCKVSKYILTQNVLKTFTFRYQSRPAREGIPDGLKKHRTRARGCQRQYERSLNQGTGRSRLHALLQDVSWSIREVSKRNPNKPAAWKALTAGAQNKDPLIRSK